MERENFWVGLLKEEWRKEEAEKARLEHEKNRKELELSIDKTLNDLKKDKDLVFSLKLLDKTDEPTHGASSNESMVDPSYKKKGRSRRHANL